MHARLITSTKALPNSFWNLGIASALCQRANFTITSQTEGDAHCVTAETLVQNGKGRTNLQVNNQSKSTHFDTPYGENISFAANTEELRRDAGAEKMHRLVDGWRMEDSAKKFSTESKFERKFTSGSGGIEQNTTYVSTTVLGGEKGSAQSTDETLKACQKTLGELRGQHQAVCSSAFDKSAFATIDSFDAWPRVEAIPAVPQLESASKNEDESSSTMRAEWPHQMGFRPPMFPSLRPFETFQREMEAVTNKFFNSFNSPWPQSALPMTDPSLEAATAATTAGGEGQAASA